MSKSTGESGKVLVPPDAVHTPGDTLMGTSTVGRVAVPVDAEADQDSAREAHAKAAAGDLVDVELDDSRNAELADGGAVRDAESRTDKDAADGSDKAPATSGGSSAPK
jgi:hypothetical protein